MSHRVSPPTANGILFFPHERTHARVRVEYASRSSTFVSFVPDRAPAKHDRAA
jgi:hypothetical protein